MLIREMEEKGILWLYDIDSDAPRPAVQADLNNFMAMNRAYGKIRSVGKTAHEELMKCWRRCEE